MLRKCFKHAGTYIQTQASGKAQHILQGWNAGDLCSSLTAAWLWGSNLIYRATTKVCSERIFKGFVN